MSSINESPFDGLASPGGATELEGGVAAAMSLFEARREKYKDLWLDHAWSAMQIYIPGNWNSWKGFE